MIDRTAPLIRLQNGLQQLDGAAIALAAHSLKGSAGYFDADDLHDICRLIEAAADAQDFASVANLLAGLEAGVAKALARVALQ